MMPGAPDQRVTMFLTRINRSRVYHTSLSAIYNTSKPTHNLSVADRPILDLGTASQYPSTLSTYLQQACSFIYTSTILNMFHSSVIKDIICKSPRLVCLALPRTVHNKSSIKATTCVHIFSARYVSFL